MEGDRASVNNVVLDTLPEKRFAVVIPFILCLEHALVSGRPGHAIGDTESTSEVYVFELQLPVHLFKQASNGRDAL